MFLSSHCWILYMSFLFCWTAACGRLVSVMISELEIYFNKITSNLSCCLLTTLQLPKRHHRCMLKHCLQCCGDVLKSMMSGKKFSYHMQFYLCACMSQCTVHPEPEKSKAKKEGGRCVHIWILWYIICAAACWSMYARRCQIFFILSLKLMEVCPGI